MHRHRAWHILLAMFPGPHDPLRLTVALLDDHLSVLLGHTYALKEAKEIEIAGIAQFGEDLEPLLSTTHVDVLLLDIGVPTSRSNDTPYPVLHLVPKWLDRFPHLTVLVISMRGERAFVQSMLEAGVSGYILKDDDEAIRNLANIVRSVASGGIYLSEPLRALIQRRRSSETSPDLTPRQLEALSLSVAYPQETTAQLAQRMLVQHSTFRNLLSMAYVRLGASNRASAMVKAQQLGIFPSSL